MNKMTPKEAQEVLENWKLQTIENNNNIEFELFDNANTINNESIGDFVEHLLEAAKVVEREKAFTILNRVALKTRTTEALDLVEEAQRQILSDNQEQNEGN